MLSICLFFKTFELKYAYKLYAYKKRVKQKYQRFCYQYFALDSKFDMLDV